MNNKRNEMTKTVNLIKCVKSTQISISVLIDGTKLFVVIECIVNGQRSENGGKWEWAATRFLFNTYQMEVTR